LSFTDQGDTPSRPLPAVLTAAGRHFNFETQ
jgi:hypothetical protein